MLVLGCVGQIGAQGGHIALVSKFRAGLPDRRSAVTINNYCVSGLTAIGQAAAAIEAGQIDYALAGGVESMSRVPFMGDKADFYAETELPERARYMPVAVAADLLAMDQNISRAELDAVTITSHRNAAQAEANAQRSRIPVQRDDGRIALDRDDAVRPATSARDVGDVAAGVWRSRQRLPRGARRRNRSIIATRSRMRRRFRTAPGLRSSAATTRPSTRQNRRATPRLVPIRARR